ncbi:hypothetical protein [Chthonobacter rhizosphaerae]|uniref:hypothetical protein n=1 Tax=Chthonobacter rhizosphaerae TaxID=2735553 RepID=UPI0015EE90F2|nr:hypothetical protein [Chthonobacter rhizosphaerae]
MNSTASLFFKSGVLFLLVGLGAGIGMAASHDHTIAPAHAHLNLLGFVLSVAYGTYFALSPAKANGLLPRAIWGLHTLAVVVMFPTLSLMLLGNAALEPVVAVSSIVAFVAALLFAFVVFRPARATVTQPVGRVASTA